MIYKETWSIKNKFQWQTYAAYYDDFFHLNVLVQFFSTSLCIIRWADEGTARSYKNQWLSKDEEIKLSQDKNRQNYLYQS